MNKNEWFKSFQRELSGLPFDEEQRAIDYYRELYADKADEGMKEKDIIKSFGSPALAAQEILQNGVNTETNTQPNTRSKDGKVAPMPELKEDVDKFAVLVKRTIGLMSLLFADSIVFSIFWNLIKRPFSIVIDAIVEADIAGIFMSLGLTLIIAAIAIMAMSGLVRATIRQALKITKGVIG